MPLPPPITRAGPPATSAAALMAWLDPPPRLTNVDGVSQPLCQDGVDVVRNLALSEQQRAAIVEEVNTWLAIGRIGRPTLPEGIPPDVARILCQRIGMLRPGPPRPAIADTGRPLGPGDTLHKAKGISHRELGTGRIGRTRRKSKMTRAYGKSDAFSIGQTRSGKAVHGLGHPNNMSALQHFDRAGAMGALASGYHGFSHNDHHQAAAIHNTAAEGATGKTRAQHFHIAAAHAALAGSGSLKSAARAVQMWRDVLRKATA